MSRHERYEQRDRCFSNWHRYACEATSSAVDLDLWEYCRQCAEPLLLIESARDVGQARKVTTALRGLAERAQVRAITVLWTPSDYYRELPPHCLCQQQRFEYGDCDHGITSFRWQSIWPEVSEWQEASSWQMARWIDRIHRDHILGVHRRSA